MNYVRVKVKLIILVSLALIIIPNLLVNNQRDMEVSLDEKNIIEVITPQPPRESSIYYEATDGYAHDVYVSGDCAYVGATSSGLAVIDISDPTDPETLDYVAMNGFANDIFVSGDYAYIGAGILGLVVIDISDPTDPGMPVSENTNGSAHGVYVSGDYAYVGDRSWGLAVIDISDPTDPGMPIYKDTNGSAYGVYVSGDYAYVADGSWGLAVIDISDPTDPGTPIYKDTNGSAGDVYVSGDYAYVADGSWGLAVIDISDPTDPGTPIYKDTNDWAHGIYVSGDYAYVGDGISGLAIIDISDPTDPRMPFYEDTDGSTYGVYVSGDHAYVGDGSKGLAVIDISKPINPGTPFYEDTDGSARDVYVSGDYAYVADRGEGLAVIDISDPTDPGTPIYKDTNGSAYGVYVSGDYAYVADGSEGLAVIDISDPTGPGTPIYKDTNGSANDVYVSGDYAYVGDGSEGLAVIDISDPTDPGTPIYKDTNGSAYGVYVSGDYAYLGLESEGLAVIDISDPTDPGTPIYEDTDGWAYGVYVSGDYAYVADFGKGLAIINISDPTDPGTPVYEDTISSARDVYVSGDYAYVASYDSGLAVINISDPTDPGMPVYEYTNSSAYGVYVSGDYAYVAVYNSGLAVIQVRRRLDIVDPIITILNPNINNNLFGKTAPSFSVKIEDIYPGIDTMWYTIDGGITNTSFTTNESINQILWDNMLNGTVTIRFYANDTSGNINWEEIVVRKDILGPLITINSPNSNDLFGSIAPDYNISIVDGNLQSIWYRLLNGTVTTENTTITDLIGVFGENVWDNVGNGTVTIQFFANDTLGNNNFSEVIVRKDIFVPIITINSPILNDIFSFTAPDFNISVSGSNLDTTWYTLGNGITNYTFIGLIGKINQSAWNNQVEGFILIKFYINNTLNVIGYDEIIVIKDTIDPNIHINYPIPNELVGSSAPIFNVEISDINGIDTMWYTLDGGITNTTFTANELINQILWDNMLNGTVTIRFYANDTPGNINWEEVVVRKDILVPIITINLPEPDQKVGEIAPTYKISILDGNLDKYWYTLDGGLTNITITNLMGPIDQTIWEGISEGSVTIRFYANDTLGHIGWNYVRIIKTIPPGPPFNIWVLIIIGIIILSIVAAGFTIKRKIKHRKLIIKAPKSVGTYTIQPKGAKITLTFTEKESGLFKIIFDPPPHISPRKFEKKIKVDKLEKLMDELREDVLPKDDKEEEELLPKVNEEEEELPRVDVEKEEQQQLDPDKLIKIKAKQLSRLKEIGTSFYKLFLPGDIQKEIKSEELKNIGTIELRLDSNLFIYPWELFYDGEEFLGITYNIGRLDDDPGTVIPYPSIGDRNKVKVLIIGDPTDTQKWAREEAKDINKRLKKIKNVKTKLLIGSNDASHSKVISNLSKNYDFIHFTGHGEAIVEEPDESGIQLKDGTLTASELQDIKGARPPILAFINACESGMEQRGFENQIKGLASSFIRNGINYIGSVWKIHDKVAYKTSLSFYSELLRGFSIGESLKNAKKSAYDYFKGKRLGWASYILFGDPNLTLDKKIKSKVR